MSLRGQPSVACTVADLFRCNDRLFITYHALGTPWDLFAPVGCLAGGALYAFGWKPYPSVYAMMGTSGFALGCAGMALGLSRLCYVSSKGENLTPKPWNDAYISRRADGLSRNFMVRVLDLSAWVGMGVAGIVLLAKGGPVPLNLSAGTMGYIQALTLGSSVGSVCAFLCLCCVSSGKEKNGANGDSPDTAPDTADEGKGTFT